MTVQDPAKTRAADESAIGRWSWLYSVNLTLWLLGLLILAMAVGTVIPRSIFASWWFIALFALLAVNLAACAVRRAAVNLRAQGAGRGGLRGWGTIIVHSGVVVVLLGAGFGRLPGRSFDRIAAIAARGTYRVEMGARSFTIRLLEAGAKHTPEGFPTKFWAKVLVLPDSESRPLQYTIIPNHPLRYRGANIVLDSLLSSPKYAIEVRRGGGAAQYVPVVEQGGRVNMMSSVKRLADPPWLVWVRDLRTTPAAGPEARVRLDESGSVTANRREIGWVGARGADYKGVHFELVSAGGGDGAQLGVHRDPGVPVVWAGFAMILIGCLIALFVNTPRR